MERFQLDCCITGFPIPSVVWYHNGLQLEDDSIAPFSIPDQRLVACSSVLLPAVESDSGLYACQGTNTAGNITSLPSLVLIQGNLVLTYVIAK